MKNKIILIAILISSALFAVEFNATEQDNLIKLDIKPADISINAATHIVIYDAERFEIFEQTYSNTSNSKIVDNPGRFAIYAGDNSPFTVYLNPKKEYHDASFELRTYLSQDISSEMPTPDIDFEHKTITLKGNPDSEDLEIIENISIAAYPNPFREQIEVKIDLPKSQQITVSIFDILGKTVTILADDQLERGNHSFIWYSNSQSGDELSQGVYFCRIDGEGIAEVKQLYLME
ncbi:MAG: T9SS type A sorting domain-containing protein [Candidatus Zixiibacteriota bacterium]